MFKNLKSLFIVEDENAPKKSPSSKPKAKTPEKKTKTPVNQAVNQTVSPSAKASEGKVNNKFLEILFGAMEKNNIEGFDYLEFKQALQNLKNMPMDEQTRYQSAYAMAKTMGITPTKLVETANFYINILKQEEQKFGQALANQRAKQIGNKETTSQQLAKQINAKKKQIELLTKEINQHQKQMEQFKKEISDSTVKVESTKNDFIASFNTVVGQIKADIENIRKYLK